MSDKKSWRFHAPRWQITAELRTDSPLHIGSGDTATRPELKNEENKHIQINACVKDGSDKPYLPGSTLKGALYAWLKPRIDEKYHEDLKALFGTDNNEKDLGMGGRAEFHNAKLITLLTEGENYPHWDKNKQTYIDVSIAVNRHTRTVAHRKLFHTELVPPNVGFEVNITGMMTEQQAGLLIRALQAFSEPEHAATLGADDTTGKGRMFLFGNVKVKRMTAEQVCTWLNSEKHVMAEQALTELSKEEVSKLIANILPLKQREILTLSLQMDGAFLINNPATKDTVTDQQPLLDSEGKSLLTAKSLHGALRSQAERIMRTLGIHCCDTQNPCKAIYKLGQVNTLCPVCQVFGATGWKSPLHIHRFKYTEAEKTPLVRQNFVAIDRFHGGGKHSALFNSRFSLRPKFTGAIELDDRMPDWGRGLLALVLRDLNEGDIKLGLGANKGYGGVEKVTLEKPFTDSELDTFREKLTEFNALTGFKTNNPPIPESINTTTAAINPSAPENNSFHNPYHFIPVKEPKTDTWLDKKDLNTDKNPHSHALYRRELYHGRIHCTLMAETPFFIGSGKTDDNTHPAKIENYRFNGQLAIPATSLRGLISSIAEAASNSALRVLDNDLLSYRKTMDSISNKDRPLSAIGMVIGEGNHLKLIPLALPTLRQTNGHYPLPKEFRSMFPDGKAQLKVYLNNAYTNGDMESFLADKRTWTLDNPEIYYLNLDSLHIKIENHELICKEGFEELFRKPSRNNNFVIGQHSEPKNYIPTPAHQATDLQKRYWSPGILRILGGENRANMPDTKKHELFIPVPHDFAENLDLFVKTAKAFTISEQAIERFHELADQRTDVDENLPYHLKGMKRTDKKQLRLKQGDLVYFRPDEDNPNLVAEVAFSAHWRGQVEHQTQKAAKVFNFFPRNLLPFNAGRETLSPAELLFGFIEGEDIQGKKTKDALAFAGKVRISTSRLTSAERQEPETVLKILALPKPSSPALYFRNKQPTTQAYTAKHELNPDVHQVNGRKHYLHALQDNQKVQKLSQTGNIANNDAALFPWQTGQPTENAEQKVKIKPISSGSTFEFTVDFDNLTEYELGLLCYALKPTEHYRHKLGMGKPLGLGTVNIDINQLLLIDRQKRYATDTLETARYNDATAKINDIRAQFVNRMDKDIHQALAILGNPSHVKAPVHYPQRQNQDIEAKTYEWCADNDKRGKQHLPIIDANTAQLYTLKR